MYISKSMSIKSIVEKYPETIPVFTNIGFKGLDNPGVLEKLKDISLEKAMMIKKEDVDAFIPILQQAIASTDREDTEVKEASLMGLLPCPVRIPLLEGFEKYLYSFFYCIRKYKINIKIVSDVRITLESISVNSEESYGCQETFFTICKELYLIFS